MRRLVIVLLLLTLVPQGVIFGQKSQDYRSETLGLAFEYPADWKVHEQLPTQTVIVASKTDIEAVGEGTAPTGLILSITMSSFRQIGADSPDNFTAILKSIAHVSDANPTSTRVAGADGLFIDQVDITQNIATRTMIVSIGNRRVAVIRGMATVRGWTTGGGEKHFAQLVETLNFFTPAGNEDAIGRVLWQLPADPESDLIDLSINADGSAVLITDRTRGIWQVSANGVSGELAKPEGISTFGSIGVLRTGVQFIADPTNNVIWMVDPSTDGATKLVGGTVGSARGAFGKESPQGFAFGASGIFYILDENVEGLRVQAFDRAGRFIVDWTLYDVLPEPIQSPSISTDADGNVYIIGNNTPGIIKLNAAGKIVSKDLGKEVLANIGAQAIVVDRFDSLYVATTDQGILKLSADGQLVGVIGEPYDESAPPKPGQLGKPIAMTLADSGKLLYVADMGKYPQIVAFGLNGNGALNVQAGTYDAGPISYGDTATGEISEATFIDAYTFEGFADDVITITMVPGEGSQIDPFVELLSPKGTRLAANDDAKAPDLKPADAQIKSIRLRQNATYTIRATRFGRETTTQTGSYKLTLTLERSLRTKTNVATPTPQK